MQTLRLFSVLICAFGLLGSAGCVNKTKLRGIAVRLEDIRITPTPSGADLAISVRYHNENLVAIAATGSEHRIWVGGTEIARIKSDEPIGLPNLGQATEVLSTSVNALIAAHLSALQASGSAPYRLDTTVIVEVADDDFLSKTSSNGTVTLSSP